MVISMNKVQHFEVTAENSERAQKFYSDVFGWKFIPVEGMPYTMIHTTETDENFMVKEKGVINGGMFEQGEGPKGPVVVITVENAEEHLKKVEEAGGKKIIGPQQVGDMGIYGQFTDPEGNFMGLWQSLNKE